MRNILCEYCGISDGMYMYMCVYSHAKINMETDKTASQICTCILKLCIVLSAGVCRFQCEAGALSEHHGFPGGDQRRVPAPMEGVSGNQQ